MRTLHAKKEAMMQWFKFSALALVVGLMSGCSIHETPTPAHVAMPTLSEAVEAKARWWEAYDDKTLNTLVEQALMHNFNVREAAANVAMANAYLAGAEANRYPSISGKAEGVRSRSSKEMPMGMGKTSNAFSLSAVLSYEIDVWGKIKNTKEAAANSLLASRATREAVRLGVIASVVDSYFGVLSLQAQKSIAQETLEARKASHALLKEKARLGMITSYDALLGKSGVIDAKATLATLEEALVRQESALHVMLGSSPSVLFEAKGSFDEGRLPAPIVVPEGLPAALLEQRPDIQASLHALKAANLDIKVAKAAHFPSISLSGVLGFSSPELNSLVGTSARTWSAGGSLVAPLFDYGRIEAGVAQRQAARELARIGFEQSVTQAFAEVHEAQRVRESIYKAKAHALEQTQIALTLASLAKERYDAGITEYNTVLEAKQDVLQARLGLVRAYQGALSADISLIKALGGGWSHKDLVSSQ
jgi:multidrug efflux system outer membrane protein